MKQISGENNIVKNVRKGNNTEMYGSGRVHTFSIYYDKDTNKEYLVDINTENFDIACIEEIIKEV